MPSSNYLDILNATAALIQGLNLTLGAQPVTVSVRKLPAVEETLDTLPVVLVCPARKPESSKRISFEDTSEVVYRSLIVIVAAGNRDFVTNLDAYLAWRQQIRQLFQQAPLAGGTTGASAVYDVRTDLEAVIDPAEVNANYDYLPLGAEYTAAETTGTT